MAKMTKTAVVELAKRAARADSRVTGMTFDQLEALSYDERKARASSLAIDTESRRSQLEPHLSVAYIGAYADEVLAAWSRVDRDRQAARNAFARLMTSKTVEQAGELVHALLTSMNVRGATISERFGGGVYVNVERGWAVGATLSVSFERVDGTVLTNPDNANQRAGEFAIKTELGWSSTGRTIAEAVAAMKLYSELIDAAAEIESVMTRERVIWRMGDFPEPVKSEPVVAPEPTTPDGTVDATGMPMVR